jgi:hypothetical protein
MIRFVSVDKETSHQKRGVLNYTAVKTLKNQIIKANDLTENTLLPQYKDHKIDVI